MPKKKPPETQEDQVKRFESAVQEMLAAGELSPTDEPFERAMKGVAQLRQDWFDGVDRESRPSKPDPQDG